MYKPKEFHGTGVKIVNMGELFAYDFVGDQPMKRVEVTDNETSRFGLQDGDLLFARRSLIESGAGKCVIARNMKEVTVFESSLIRARLDVEKAIPSFYFYYFRSPQGRSKIESIITGAAQKGIRSSDLADIEIDYPPLDVQRRIASILSAYDDLIENNTRRIEILEEMARRLYEEWFVHFRFPGHEKVKFKESELGEIPEGWEVQGLGSVAQVNPESIKPKAAPDEVHYIDIASVSPGRIDKTETMLFSDAPGRARRIVKSGDVLWSCVRPNRRSCAMVVEPKKDTVASTGFAVLRAESISKHYLYQCVLADQFVSYLVNRATGAAYPAVKASDFKEEKIIVPQGDLLSKFDEAVAPMRSLIHRLERKNANLRAQRDLLLPKLVSGEIDVSDIPMPDDKEVEAA